MAGGIIIILCVLALIGVGELLIRAVEGLIGAQAADPMQKAHGDVPRRAIEPEVDRLREAGL